MLNNEYKKRWITPLLRKMVEESPVTVLTGARQVGKTTLILHELKNSWQYFSLDDYDVQTQLKRNPELILEGHSHIIIDEAQRIPEIFPLIKLAGDRNPQKRFVLSGSTNLLLMANISESLAGRAEFLDMEPMTRAEILSKKPPEIILNILKEKDLDFKKIKFSEYKLKEIVWNGGMPAVLNRIEPDSLVRWREGYIASYLERDLRQLSQIDKLPDFRKVMQLAALRAGNILNQSDLARDAGLTQPTTHRYLNLLEISRLMVRLPAYRASRNLRLVKSPKIMWVDSGLACHLAGFYNSEQIKQSREWGNMLECFVFGQLKTITSLLTPKPNLYYWRTQKGDEVDLIIEYGNYVAAFEIKASSRVKYEDTKGLQIFMKNYPRRSLGILLYNGKEIKKMGDTLFAVPIGALWE